jgi:two-component system chemotaxis response regulator CheY
LFSNGTIVSFSQTARNSIEFSTSLDYPETVDKSLNQLIVLIVEDHFAMRKIVRTVLHSIGIRNVVEAIDGAQALQELKTRNRGMASDIAGSLGTGRAVDLVIADWNMPKMSGIQLLESVRRDPNLVSLPFMMLTAENSREQILEAVNLGVTDYIIKPFSSNLFEAKLKSLLEARFNIKF